MEATGKDLNSLRREGVTKVSPVSICRHQRGTQEPAAKRLPFCKPEKSPFTLPASCSASKCPLLKLPFNGILWQQAGLRQPVLVTESTSVPGLKLQLFAIVPCAVPVCVSSPLSGCGFTERTLIHSMILCMSEDRYFLVLYCIFQLSFLALP